MRGNSKILLVSLVLASIASVGCGRRAAGTNAKAAPLMAAAVAGVAEIQNRSREWSAMATNYPVMEGSVVRTGADSSVMMNSQVSADRIVLGEDSEVGVERWAMTAGSGTGVENVGLNVRRGVVVVDVPVLSGASNFEVKGSNFVAVERCGGGGSYGRWCCVGAVGDGGLCVHFSECEDGHAECGRDGGSRIGDGEGDPGGE